ncbi:hypothetical protein KVMX100_250063 [Klebsiella variicola]|nr:hypothetical protein KVMX100_250063 [Klebsiella variicola]
MLSKLVPLNTMVTADASAEQLEKTSLTGTLAPLDPALPENVCEETVPKSILFDGSTATSQEGASMVPVMLKLTVLLPS